MTLPQVSIRYQLYTEMGPVGNRLQRGVPLPTYQFDFPETSDGRKAAQIAMQQLQDYVQKYHIPRGKK